MEADCKAPESLHAGHRQRLREAFQAAELEGFSDVEVLELLLTFTIPRKDVNPLAHRLLEEFGSLHRVFEAPTARLLRVPGVGERTAQLIRFCPALWRRQEQSRARERKCLRNTGEIGQYLTALSEGLREERAWLLCLDARCCVLECREVCTGAVNAVNLPLRKLVETALLANASVVVLAHNHTNGTLLPSIADLEYTRDAFRALELMEIRLLDHVLLCDRSYLSMRASGMMQFT